MKVYIKNMVCPRCVMAVKNILDKLDINYTEVKLGEVIMNETPGGPKIYNFRSELENLGFEVLDDDSRQIVEQIKTLIINQIYFDRNEIANYSELLSSQLHRDYSFLSKLFSTIEGITIEHYIISQKIERVKELLSYDQQTLSQISVELGYSSVAHLSAQFKKITGMTPSQFKTQNIYLRKGLDQV